MIEVSCGFKDSLRDLWILTVNWCLEPPSLVKVIWPGKISVCLNCTKITSLRKQGSLCFEVNIFTSFYLTISFYLMSLSCASKIRLKVTLVFKMFPFDLKRIKINVHDWTFFFSRCHESFYQSWKYKNFVRSQSTWAFRNASLVIDFSSPIHLVWFHWSFW